MPGPSSWNRGVEPRHKYKHHQVLLADDGEAREDAQSIRLGCREAWRSAEGQDFSAPGRPMPGKYTESFYGLGGRTADHALEIADEPVDGDTRTLAKLQRDTPLGPAVRGYPLQRRQRRLRDSGRRDAHRALQLFRTLRNGATRTREYARFSRRMSSNGSCENSRGGLP